MRCPFLREAQVKFCRASAFRKMIVRPPEQTSSERCCTPDYINCPVCSQHHEERPILDHCPFLHESLVQYCAAGSVTKFIPYSESVLSRCGTDNHKYCEPYLSLANAGSGINGEWHSMRGGQAQYPDSEHTADGLHVPERLWYSANHMWLDVSADGLLHVGIDAFLTRILGTLDSVTFLTLKGMHRPAVVLTQNGVDLHMVFPNPMLITKTNSYLRSTPSKILADPYTLGWLFEGTENRDSHRSPVASVTENLIPGKEAIEWMEDELRRANATAQALDSQHQQTGPVLMADGGGIQPGLARMLGREEMLQFMNQFCASQPYRRKPL